VPTISSLLPSRRRRPRIPHNKHTTRVPLPIIPGYTILAVDANILLSSLSMLASVIESLRWMIVIPVPVIVELNGLSSNSSPLGEASQAAMAYVSSHIRSHSTPLKIQTSKGNYLSSLGIFSEQADFQDTTFWERNMDDLNPACSDLARRSLARSVCDVEGWTPLVLSRLCC
jgi:protein SMG6